METGNTSWDAELDASDLLCPLPVLKARKRLQKLASGQKLRILATDPAAVIDVPHFCTEQCHKLTFIDADVVPMVFIVQKG